MSASVMVDAAFAFTESALPPERSALEARRDTASLRLASASREPFCCPKTEAEKHRRTAIVQMMLLPAAGCARYFSDDTFGGSTPSLATLISKEWFAKVRVPAPALCRVHRMFHCPHVGSRQYF